MSLQLHIKPKVVSPTQRRVDGASDPGYAGRRVAVSPPVGKMGPRKTPRRAES